MRLRFTKMHGLGNDFVMIDGVSQKFSVSSEKIRKLADRNFGVGCDQVLIVEPPTQPQADFRYRIFNADGDEVENCGNGARCFAIFVRKRGLCSKNEIVAETLAGNLVLKVNGDESVTVDMGPPELNPEGIPFTASERALTYTISVNDDPIEISAVSMGNPHSVCFVDDVDAYPVELIGAAIERHPKFPEKVNAGFIEVVTPTLAKLRVFERGVGETLACGTGACAAMVAAHLRGKLESVSTIRLPGGDLNIEWRGEGHPVLMTGPATTVFSGQIKI